MAIEQEIADLSEWVERNPAAYGDIMESLRHPSTFLGSLYAWKALLRNLGRSAAIGGGLDGLIAALRGWKAYDNGNISKDEFVRHVASETGCGAVSSGTGGLVTQLVSQWLGKFGTVAVISGMGTSVVVRQMYRSLGVGPEITDEDLKTDQEFEAESLEEEIEAIEDRVDDDNDPGDGWPSRKHPNL